MSRSAPSDHPIHELLAERWSPVCFREDAVQADDVRRLLEAARWAPSSFNEQPWRFVVGRRGDAAWQGILDCLVDANRAWARKAPVLLLSVAHTVYARNGKPNAHAWHDVGAACAALCLQATALGLQAHPMGGFSADAARERFGIPSDCEPVACLAVGVWDAGASRDPALAARDGAPRRRAPQADFAFGARWGEAAEL